MAEDGDAWRLVAEAIRAAEEWGRLGGGERHEAAQRASRRALQAVARLELAARARRAELEDLRQVVNMAEYGRRVFGEAVPGHVEALDRVARLVETATAPR